MNPLTPDLMTQPAPLENRARRRAHDRHRPASGAPYKDRTIRPSAREWFPYLRQRLLDSRPIIGERVVIPRDAKPDSKGVIRTSTVPIYGKPTFRNILVDGIHQ